MRIEAGTGWRIPLSALLAREPALLLLAAAAAWLVLLLQARGMGAMGGTMGLGLADFVLLWLVMMAAMMLPAVAPVAAAYARSASGLRPAILAAFVIGYAAVWALVGLVAFPLATVAAAGAMDNPAGGRFIAPAAFLVVALYQLSPVKRSCLLLCSAALREHADETARPPAHLVAGVRYGLVCLGSSWALMLVMVPIGFMNIPLLLALASVVFVERYWLRGLTLARLVGVAALVLAPAAIWAPQLSSNLR